MRYMHILLACCSEVWAMEREKLDTICRFIVLKAEGGSLTQEEVKAISKTRVNDVARAEGAVGIIPIFGSISQRMSMMSEISGGTSTEQIATDFRGMMNNDAVKAIVLNIDSPGGVSSGVAELADEIFNSRGGKPIIAQVNSAAASAAYWIACAADEVVVTPSGRAGSVGVYSIHQDISKMLETKGVKNTIVSAGRKKVSGNPYEPLSDEARALIQKRVDFVNNMFVTSLAKMRSTTKAHVNDQFGEGEVFSPPDLISRGMADGIATLPETLQRFGVDVNPVAARGKIAAGERAESIEEFKRKLAAGDPLSVRELEKGLKGLAGLTNSQAERAVRVCLPSVAQGEPEKKEAGRELVQAFDGLRRALADFKLPTQTRSDNE